MKPIGEERGSKREREREGEPHELLEWCASQSPLAYPKIPGAGNVKARRTTDAIPQRGSAGIISEGNGGLKWRTNFSKTSSEGKCARIAPSFPPPPPTHTLFFLTLPLSLFSPLCVVFRVPTLLFYQINISQNKSQDNFKLASEERGGKKRKERRGRGGERVGERERGGRIWFSLRASCEVESLSSLLTSFWGLWFLSSPSWSQLHQTDEVVTTAYECQMRRNTARVGGTFTYSFYHKQKNPRRPGQSAVVLVDFSAILRTKARQQPAITLNSRFSPPLSAAQTLNGKE